MLFVLPALFGVVIVTVCLPLQQEAIFLCPFSCHWELVILSTEPAELSHLHANISLRLLELFCNVFWHFTASNPGRRKFTYFPLHGGLCSIRELQMCSVFHSWMGIYKKDSSSLIQYMQIIFFSEKGWEVLVEQHVVSTSYTFLLVEHIFPRTLLLFMYTRFDCEMLEFETSLKWEIWTTGT